MRAVQKISAALATIALMSMLATPATAHTETETTSPSSGETVTSGEQLISVSFTDKILDLADSSEIVVVDADGNVAPTDCSGIENKKIYTNAFLAKKGKYQVTWRTVAEDGHPISGKFSFQVSEDSASEYSKPACATDLPTPAPTVITAPPAKTVTPTDNGFSIYLVFFPIGAAIAAVWIFGRRRKRTKE
jgi:methionine-rich copper-binding protein CopC